MDDCFKTTKHVFFDLQCRGNLSWCCVGSRWRVCDLCSTSQIPSSTLPPLHYSTVRTCDWECAISPGRSRPAVWSVVVLCKVSLRVLKPGLNVTGGWTWVRQRGKADERCHISFNKCPVATQSHIYALRLIGCPFLFKCSQLSGSVESKSVVQDHPNTFHLWNFGSGFTPEYTNLSFYWDYFPQDVLMVTLMSQKDFFPSSFAHDSKSS